MANEYLKRTPTSTGNRKVWTWSAWVKRNNLTDGSQHMFSAGSQASNWGGIDLGATEGLQFINVVTSVNGRKRNPKANRDSGSWIHYFVSVDTTRANGKDRIKIYENGVFISAIDTVDTEPALNALMHFNSTTAHHLGKLFDGASNFHFEGELSDVYLIDGQALTPDVFGFYKDGDGYISVGSTYATDFRPGQWVPKKPSVIKNTINNNGGFGVNGFYLPINDSSNFGADFHCDPNSIITLKDETAAQPKNGAPTTTDSYVSQLRSDPYAANLVLAVPGISTSTIANLITNGTFDNNTAGWTGGNGTISWSDGKLLVTSGGSGNGYAYQSFTTVIGERYSVKFDYTTGTGGLSLIWIGTTAGGGEVTQRGDIVTSGTYNISFTATATTTFIRLGANTPTASLTYYYDNVVVKQEDAPRDYSADIKGSGTNKTPTLSGNSGVGYEIPGYYGSAYTSSSNNDYLEFPGTSGDFNVGTGDFTIEMWLNPDSTQPGNARLFGQDANSAGNWDVYINSTSASNQIGMMGGGTSLTGGSGSSYGNLVGEQWNHFCLERYNGQLTTYINGVAVYTQSYTSSIGDNNTFRIGQIGSNVYGGVGYGFNGDIQDFRFYKGVAKYKGGFDVPKPYTPVGIATWRAVPDTTANNFATINPLGSGAGTFTDGNLTYNSFGDTGNANIGISTGNFYFEARVSNASPTYGYIGVMEATEQNPLRGGGWVTHGAVAYKQNGDQYFKAKGSGTSSSTSFGASYTTGDIIGVACDITNNTVTFYKNGVSQGTTSEGPSSIQSNGTFAPLVFGDVVEWNVNFGQNPSFSGTITAGTYTDGNGKGLFKYQPPTGFLALCEDNLPTPAIADPGDYFKTVLWTGSASTRGIAGVGFKPDLVWAKSRTNPATGIFNTLVDSVRGAPLSLYSNSNDSEDAPGGVSSPASVHGGISSFDNDGFSIMSGSSDTFLNNSGTPYVAWCWKAGGAAVTNNDGTITSQVSANQDAGFSIVSYTATGSTGSIGHGLGKTPAFVITKHRNLATHWRIWHKSLTAYNYTLFFNTGAQQIQPAYSALPTSSVINLDSDLTGAYNFVTYCWAEIEGFSKFGSYVGNASTDGPFVYCGFKPAVVIIKWADGSASWVMQDSSRSSTNPSTLALNPDSSGAELDASTLSVDFLSNGFKIRNTNGSYNNASTYIFAAFAESPFKTANAK